ncbi:hypothetical protein NDU88_002941 [Pleurodeles waltl]|uniref:Reverse transcriptase domain-containing protein n=1 Tax=Pleurodeles waltl TaxID=8319 RepID=A0AAV7UX16_PLEWA|nr:hypothetical protein NDU88_002941 [Pleurodeles waltl]
MCSADCWTDHRLILSKLNIHIQPRRHPQGKKTNRQQNVSKLEQHSVRQNVSEDLNSKLNNPALGQMVKKRTGQLLEIWSTTPLSLTWTRTHANIRTGSTPMMKIFRSCWMRSVNPSDPSSKTLHVYPRRQPTTPSKAKFNQSSEGCKTHGSAERQMKYRTLTATTPSVYMMPYGPQSSGTSSLLSANGSTLLTDKNTNLKRWAEHFNNVLNSPSSINTEVIDRMLQVAINTSLAKPPKESEVKKAIKLLSNDKTPGTDSILAKMYKAGGPVLLQKLTKLFKTMRQQECISQEFKDASIVHLYQRKGNRQSCDNHRGISLLAIAGKILARVLLNCLTQHMEDVNLPEGQCGFREGRGTVDMIFAAHHLKEKCQKQNRVLYTTFIDLTKAFDTVSHKRLLQIIEKFGCPGIHQYGAPVPQWHACSITRQWRLLQCLPSH